MELEYYKVVKQERRTTDCEFNEGCRCADKYCWKCGWNPVVAAHRRRKILAKLGIADTDNGG